MLSRQGYQSIKEFYIAKFNRKYEQVLVSIISALTSFDNRDISVGFRHPMKFKMCGDPKDKLYASFSRQERY